MCYLSTKKTAPEYSGAVSDKDVRERTTYIPLTFRDKLKFQLPTSSHYLFPNPFGHWSSLVHLMGSINPLFDHPRLASRHQLKVLNLSKIKVILFG